MPAATSLPTTTSGKSLFSQHYLETRLPGHPEWLEDPQAVFDAIRDLWQKAQRYGETWNEAQTEDEFVKPTLAALGWSYIPQVKNSRGGRVNRPDYALFADEVSKDAAYPHQGNDAAFYSRALAIAEAKYWGRPLSRKDSSGRDTWKRDNNPSYQMVSYLVGTRSPWGVLTNGQVWRLYSREVSSTASEYYEVDLEGVFGGKEGNEGNEGKFDAFKRFWLFFRRAAFTPDAQGRTFIQRIHEGSATYAKEISDKLKELVFDEVMPEIATGFFAYRRRELGIGEESEESLQEIYRASLSLLYKLLFVLYAEARSLLPVQNPAYWEESLTLMARQFAERIDRGQTISDATHATRQYDSLLALFRRIDQGDASLGVPRYDGGLFNPGTPDNQFLAQHKLSDRAVATTVDILVRDAGQPVDYAYISVRNLGSIYEGLLENRLEPVANSSESWQLTLVNDKGERKATGSYYTPDYIVSYIVEQTLSPILDERQERFAAAMDRIAGLRRKLERTADTTTIGLLRRELDAAERQAREAFLGVTVCDPAMGSGHFLVNAVDFLTDGIIERMQAYHDGHEAVAWQWNPIQRLIERVRGEILDEMARQGIDVDAGRLDDTALLTRLVMKRCIYGVDLNPMAVELAKLSLWLHSFTVGAPLSFLDHHLRWGNSLIGADVRTVEAAIRGEQSGQLALWGSPFASLLSLTTTMLEIADRADATLADVRQSAGDFATLQRALTPYKQALDLWVSQYFGNGGAAEFLTVHGEEVLPALEGKLTPSAAHSAAITEARRLWQEKRFFHWDLEFPEVFVDLAQRDWAENPGFDAVISNPPYFDIKGMPRELVDYLFRVFPTTHMRTNIFASFLEKALTIVRLQSGQVGFIIPTAFLTQVSYSNLRRLVLENCWLRDIVRLSNELFGDSTGEVKVDTCVVVIQKETAAQTVSTTVLIYDSFDRTGAISVGNASRTFHVNQSLWIDQGDATIALGAIEWSSLIDKIRVNSVRLDECCEFCLGLTPYDKYSGHTPEQIRNKVFHANAQLDPSYKKLLQSGDVRRYEVIWNGEVWIRYGDWLAAPRESRFFTEARILVQQIVDWSSLRMFIGWTDEELYNSQNQFNLLQRGETDLKFILAVLNSSLMTFYHRRVFLDIALQRFQKVLIKDAKTFPIRRIGFTTQITDRTNYAEKGRRLYEQFCAKEDYACVLGFVDHHLEQGQSDVVHDLLAFLAEKMIAMNKEKQAEVAGFLAWLEREIGAPIDTLSNKTALRNYLGDYQKGEGNASLEDVLAVLRKNRRKLAVDPGARAFQERLKSEYETSLAKLLPLKQRLAATDRLIDQIVYRLYELNDEEIAIVEGRRTGSADLTEDKTFASRQA